MAAALYRISAAQTRPLRSQLLRQGVPPDQLRLNGDDDADALHIGAFLDGEQVGIATVLHQPPASSVGCPPNYPNLQHAHAWRLRAMATTESVRGMGVGRQILLAAIGYCAEQGGAFLWCDARVSAVGFYEKLGFLTLGAEYHVPDVGAHYFMQRKIFHTDVNDADPLVWLADLPR
ncbi:MAG: GNAT family N-acetyltransferase [Phototrophicaceae bacterium]|jgi:GNAT superfamily N-acetyltransferase